MSGLTNIIQDREFIQPSYSTLILNGESDIELSITISKKWHSKLENSKFYVIQDAGHCANIDNPNKFNELVNNFIKQQ